MQSLIAYLSDTQLFAIITSVQSGSIYFLYCIVGGGDDATVDDAP